MKSIIFVDLSLVLVLGLILTGCSSTTSSPNQTITSAPTTSTPATSASTQAPNLTESIKEKTLIFESYIPPNSPAHKAELQFAQGLTDATGGKIKTQHNVGAVMGPANGTTTNLTNGVCDWALFSADYTPGSFPMTEMFELPIRCPDGKILTKAMSEMYKKGYFDKEYANMKFLWFFAIGPYQLFGNKQINTLADFAGVKMRVPGDVFVKISKAVGGIPVSMTSTDTYDSMQKGVVDACWGNGAQAIAWKLAEVSKYITMTNISTSIMTVAMNQATYDSLPQAAKKFIEDNRNNYADIAAQFLETGNVNGFELSRQKNIQFSNLSEADAKSLSEKVKPIFDDWVKTNEAKGLPAKQALKDLYQILTSLGVKDPFTPIE